MLKKQENKVVFDVENIQRRAADNIKRPIQTVADLEQFLAGWWCRRYSRPYKCAELLEYTLEELVYEYFDVTFREHPEVMEKFLNRLKKDDEDEDEQWLKGVMGEGYISKDEQEKRIAPIRKDIELPNNDEEEPDLSYKFDEFV